MGIVMIRATLIATTLTFGVLSLGTAETHADTRVPQSQSEISLGFAPLVKQAAPAVVNIYAKRVVEVRRSPFQRDPFFQNLFRDFDDVRPQVQNSLGSGVILSADGIVVSNYHVVGMATDISVHLNDRREYKATVLLADEHNDLAILKLEDADNMPYLQLRDSDNVEVGELVLAIGNPFGVGQTVSSGIVSGLARSGVATGSGRGYFIQTDAPINPGNSGGALIDVNGDLIGVNTSILTRSGGSNGIGFAIPSALVAQVVAQARDGNDSFVRPWAGMFGQPVDADMADGFGLIRPGGIVISALHDVSPFGSAGFQVGDVILEVDGHPVNTAPEMVFRMSVAGLGTRAKVLGLLQGTIKTVSVGLLAAPDTPPRDTLVTSKQTDIPGMTLSNINPAVLAEFGLPLGAQGVVIQSPGEIGTRIGLRVGDVLRSIDDVKISDTKSADQALRKVRRTISLDVQRGTKRIVMRFRV